ncbi:MAG: hypothetical protein NT020_09865 [Chloroflexales bacterium]|nr:hypothetical protein [Chloroflexales bacterium]
MQITPFHISIGANEQGDFVLYVFTASQNIAIPIDIPEYLVQKGGRLLQPTHTELLGDPGELGHELGAVIFPEVVRDMLIAHARTAQNSNGRLQIQIQIAVPELAALPWEWAMVPGTREWAPAINDDYAIVRLSSINEPAPPILVDGPLCILLLVHSEQTSQFSLIHTMLQSEINAKRISVNIVEVHSIVDIEHALSQKIYHVVHFVGDVLLNADNLIRIVFGSEIDVFELTDLLAQFPDIGLISVTMAGSGEPQILAMPQIFAALLMSKTINAAITFSGVSRPDTIVRFAATCYNAIIEDIPLDLAVTRGRRALTSGRRDVNWGLAQLRIVPGTERLFVFDVPHNSWSWVRATLAVIGIAVAISGALLLGRMLNNNSFAIPLRPSFPIPMSTPKP